MIESLRTFKNSTNDIEFEFLMDGEVVRIDSTVFKTFPIFWIEGSYAFSTVLFSKLEPFFDVDFFEITRITK